MADGLYIGGTVAGLAYLIAGVRLIRLSRQTGESPERLMGSIFLVWSFSYALWYPAVTELVHGSLAIAESTAYETNHVSSGTLDTVLGAAELTAITIIWFVFFPPVLYRRWISRAVVADVAEGG